MKMKVDSPVRTTYTDRNDLFPREQHPDARTNTQFLKALAEKLTHKKVMSGKWYPTHRSGPNGRRVKCLTTGKVYNTIREAARDLRVHNASIGKHLRGHIDYSHVGGMIFKEL